MSTLAIVCTTSESLCLIICVVLLTCQRAGDRFRDNLSALYTRMLMVNICVLANNIIGWLADGKTQPYAIVITHVTTFLLHFCWYILAALICNYVFVVITYKVQLPKRILYFAYAFCASMAVLLIVSQFTDWFYYYDEGNFYRRGPLHILSYGPTLTIIMSIILIFKYRKQLGSNDTLTLASFMFLPFVSLFPQIAVYGLFSLNTCITVGLLILYARIQIVRGRERELELVNARIDIILSQLQPHFLYNALTTIENVTRRDTGKAGKMISDFSQFLRVNMDSLKQTELIPFEQELQHIMIYLDFEKIRFKERLNVVTDFKITDFYLPVLTIQPLVENAVRHGVTKKREGGTVLITAKEVRRGVEITVSDDGVGFDSNGKLGSNERSHYGLENVRSRLVTKCKGTLTVESEIGKGTVCVITIPKGL